MTDLIRPRSATSVDLPVSGVWIIAVAAEVGLDGPVVTVTLPNGSTVTPPVVADSWGCWRAEYVVTATGRYIARVTTAGHGAVDFTAYVTGVVAASAMPDAADLDAYLQSFGGHSWTTDDLDDALTAESAAQRAACTIPAAYPADLRQALLRRGWRNLKMRGQPLLTIPGAEDGAATVAPGADPEVRRLERPYRKLAAL